MDPYAPPQARLHGALDEELLQPDSWDRAAQAALGFMGLVYTGIIGLFPAIMLLGADDADKVATAVGAVAVAVVSLPLAGACLYAAWGLGARAKPAWYVSLLLGGMMAASVFMPLGATILYAILRKRGRLAFGIEKPKPSESAS